MSFSYKVIKWISSMLDVEFYRLYSFIDCIYRRVFGPVIWCRVFAVIFAIFTKVYRVFHHFCRDFLLSLECLSRPRSTAIVTPRRQTWSLGLITSPPSWREGPQPPRRLSPDKLGLICVELKMVGWHPVANFCDASLEVTDHLVYVNVGWRHKRKLQVLVAEVPRVCDIL